MIHTSRCAVRIKLIQVKSWHTLRAHSLLHFMVIVASMQKEKEEALLTVGERLLEKCYPLEFGWN